MRDAAGPARSISTRSGIRDGRSTKRYRPLEPGEVVEVGAHGVAIGEGAYEEEFSLGKIGVVIPAKPGDSLRIQWDLTVPESVTRDAEGKTTVPSCPGRLGRLAEDRRDPIPSRRPSPAAVLTRRRGDRAGTLHARRGCPAPDEPDLAPRRPPHERGDYLPYRRTPRTPNPPTSTRSSFPTAC